jgi:hypothetical protein
MFHLTLSSMSNHNIDISNIYHHKHGVVDFSRLGRRKLQAKSSISEETKPPSGGGDSNTGGQTWHDQQTPLKNSAGQTWPRVTPAKDPLKDILNIKRDQSPTSGHPHHSSTLYESFVFTTPGHHLKEFGPIPPPLDPLHGIIGLDDSFVTAVASPLPKPSLPGPRCALADRFKQNDNKNFGKVFLFILHKVS